MSVSVIYIHIFIVKSQLFVFLAALCCRVLPSMDGPHAAIAKRVNAHKKTLVQLERSYKFKLRVHNGRVKEQAASIIAINKSAKALAKRRRGLKRLSATITFSTQWSLMFGRAFI